MGRDFKKKGIEEWEDLFATMPPLESKKLLFRMAAGVRGQRRRKGLAEVKLMFIDVRKPHLNAVCEEKLCVELPEELWEHGRYARLKRWLYGMRKAATGWEEDYAKKMVPEGLKRAIGEHLRFSTTRAPRLGWWCTEMISLLVEQRWSWTG